MFRRRREGEPRRGTPAAWLVVGLGNPGSEYRGTRHNLGAVAVESYAASLGATLRAEPRLRARAASVTDGDRHVLCAVPMTYMNESGAAIVPLVRRAGLEDLSRLLVVHDELDLEPGRLQLRLGGGLAGNNGLRSIASALRTNDFARLRIGIGKPPSKDRGADWVLSRPSATMRATLDESVERAREAIADVVASGLEAAAARCNGAARG